MMNSRSFVAAAAIALTSTAVAQIPCFESSRGLNLNMTYGSVTQRTLPFAFPTPAGPVSTISISSQGFVWLGANGNPGLNVSPAAFASSARIAAMWSNLDVQLGGPGVFYNTFPATGSDPARAVITWEESDAVGGGIVLAQLQMLADGRVYIHHDANNNYTAGPAIVGISGFGGYAPVDLSTASWASLDSGTDPGLFDNMPFIVNVGPTYDLAGTTIQFVPNGLGGYYCTEELGCRTGTFDPIGRGCPKPSSFYQQFGQAEPNDLSNKSLQFVPNGLGGWIGTTTTNAIAPFSNNLNLSTGACVPHTLPFPWPHPSGVATAIDICANGFVWLTSDPVNHFDFDADFTFLLQLGEPLLAPVWSFLDPSTAGGVYFDVAPGNSAVYITWSNVRPMNGNGSVTAQLAMFPNGSFEVRYGNLSMGPEVLLVGYGSGATDDPGSRDLTATPWNSGVAAAPMLNLRGTPGTRPSIGTTFGLDVDGFGAVPSLGILIIGGPLDVDLDPIATGCRAYVDIPNAGLLAFLATTPLHQLSFALANNPSDIGQNVFVQIAELRAGTNALGITFSNGGVVRLGH